MPSAEHDHHSPLSRRRFFQALGYLAPAAAVGAATYAVGASTGNQATTAQEVEADAPATAAVSGLVHDEDGSLTVAAIEIFSGDRSHARIQTDLLGRYETPLPIGTYRFVTTKGFEHRRNEITVEVRDRRRVEVAPIRLERHIDLAAGGWFPGDTHQHSTYSDGYQDVATVLASNLAAGLRWGALTDHNSVAGLHEWARGGSLTHGRDSFVSIPGQEITTELGHFNAFGLTDAIDPSTDAGTSDVERILTEVRAGGGILQLNHPHLDAPMGFADLPLAGQFDLLEVWNGKGEPNATANLATKETWFELLNSGVFVAATGDSDNHDITGGYLWAREDGDGEAWTDRGLFSGSPRTYVHLSDGLTAQSILTALVAGRSFITNGPLIRFAVDGRGPGDLASAGGREKLPVRVQVDDVRGVTRIDIVVGGAVAESVTTTGELSVDLTRELAVHEGSWVLIEAFGAEGGYAFTNPVRIRA